jgi:hypothetical protein
MRVYVAVDMHGMHGMHGAWYVQPRYGAETMSGNVLTVTVCTLTNGVITLMTALMARMSWTAVRC